MAEGMERSAALSAVAQEAGVARKKVFDALLQDREDAEGG
jgi:DNA-binding phage protein